MTRPSRQEGLSREQAAEHPREGMVGSPTVPDRPALGAYRTPWHQARAAEARAAARALPETLRREAELRAELAPAGLDPETEAAFGALVKGGDARGEPSWGATCAGASNTRSPTLATVERQYELENLWRSIAMLSPNARAVMSRDEALELLEELGNLHRRIDILRAELRRLADDL